MKVSALIDALSKLNPDGEILPTWEGHCPGDFWGLDRITGEWKARYAPDAPDAYYLICEPEPGEPCWSVE